MARSAPIPSTATAEKQKHIRRRCRPPRIGQAPPKTDAYDLAAELWSSGPSVDTPLRSRRFIEVRRRLWVMLFGVNADA
jgi:hypothetical protein